MRLVDEAIEAYAADHTSGLPSLLEEVAKVTRERTTAPQMMVGKLEGGFLQMLIRSMGAKRVLEVGTFTGFSALCMAAALPDDGKLVTCEVSELHASLARGFFEKSPDGKKIELRFGPAIDSMKSLRDESFDLVFIDADKESYGAYYEEAIRLLRKGGLVVADNTLWSGRVLAPKEDSDRAIVSFNETVQRDERVDNVLVTVRDGMMLARKR